LHLLRFSPRAEKDLKSLPKNIQDRIIKKLTDNAALDNPLVRAKSLVNLPPSTHRFRIGNYRASFFTEGHTIFIERVEIRGEAYRRT
jgi:mRNA interferase RelE/StbE